MELDWESLLDELWGHASSDLNELETKIRACLDGHSSEGLLQTTMLLITQGKHATARALLSESLRNHRATDDIKRRLELILHFKQSHTSQTLSFKSKQRSKEILLNDVNALVASEKLKAAESLLLEANESIEDPEYLSLLGRIYVLQNRPLDAAKAMQRELLLKRKQQAFVEKFLVEAEDDLPTASDLAFLNDSAISLATLEPPAALTDQTSPVTVDTLLGSSQQAAAKFPPSNQEGWWERYVEPASNEAPALADETDELELPPATTDDSEEQASEDETISPASKKSILKLAMPRKTADLSESQASVKVLKKPGRPLCDVHPSSLSSAETNNDELPDHPDPVPVHEATVVSSQMHNDILGEHDDDDLPGAYLELNVPDLMQIGLGVEDAEDDTDHDLYDLTVIELGNEHEDDVDAALDDFRDLDDDYAAYAFDPDEVFDSDEPTASESNDWLVDKLSREDRALQKSAELIVKANWPLSTLPLVQQIFVMSGWGATRLALEREIEKGLTPEELILAAHIKVIWADNDIYWISFDKTGSSRLSYYVLSWPTALLIVRSFESLPQVEEIEVFLENLFASWYENNTLRRTFKAFARYIWFRFANLEGCLPANEHFDFCDPRALPAEEYSDLGLCDTLEIDKSKRLRKFGVIQNKHPQEPGCYFSDKPPLIEEEPSLNVSGKRKRAMSEPEPEPEATEHLSEIDDNTSRIQDILDHDTASQWSKALLAPALNTLAAGQPSPSVES